MRCRAVWSARYGTGDIDLVVERQCPDYFRRCIWNGRQPLSKRGTGGTFDICNEMIEHAVKHRDMLLGKITRSKTDRSVTRRSVLACRSAEPCASASSSSLMIALCMVTVRQTAMERSSRCCRFQQGSIGSGIQCGSSPCSHSSSSHPGFQFVTGRSNDSLLARIPRRRRFPPLPAPILAARGPRASYFAAGARDAP